MRRSSEATKCRVRLHSPQRCASRRAIGARPPRARSTLAAGRCASACVDGSRPCQRWRTRARRCFTAERALGSAAPWRIEDVHDSLKCFRLHPRRGHVGEDAEVARRSRRCGGLHHGRDRGRHERRGRAATGRRRPRTTAGATRSSRAPGARATRPRAPLRSRRDYAHGRLHALHAGHDPRR